MLPDSLNLTFDLDVNDSLLAMRYLQIDAWNPVLLKLVKNPQYKLDDADVYTYSEISRMIRVNIINNLLPFAQDALDQKQSSFSVPLSLFFGGQITTHDLHNNFAQYFDSALIGLDLISASSSPKNDLFIPLHQPFIAHKNNPHTETIVSSMLLDFKITPRLEAMLLKFTPSKMKPKVRVMTDLISEHTETAINNAIQAETYEKVAAHHILRNIISSLPVLNPYLTKPKAAFYQMERKTLSFRSEI
ncbi:hypothetical protein HLH17_14525 [Acinetobacter sp. ANC 5380]|uniref:Uncharacterized protein n=1 Tax=Acinetobacter terrae TaxID=2731247 RepID=A0A7Y2RHN7_9GAMM|nr:hypothetical protein [Acinetobacter terrae]NNH78837.1 hypothetical protein [Acinetobacter terrae]